jgi:hypothetical protein
VGGIALGLHKRKSHLSGFLRENVSTTPTATRSDGDARAPVRARLGILRPVTLSVSCVCVGEVKTGRHSTAALM